MEHLVVLELIVTDLPFTSRAVSLQMYKALLASTFIYQ